MFVVAVVVDFVVYFAVVVFLSISSYSFIVISYFVLWLSLNTTPHPTPPHLSSPYWLIYSCFSFRYNHPNIVTLIGVAEHENELFLVTEYCEAGDLWYEYSIFIYYITFYIYYNLKISLITSHKHL